MGEHFISIEDLKSRIGTDTSPPIIDVRRKAIYDTATTVLPDAVWHDPLFIGNWIGELPSNGEIVVYCVHGHEVSQSTGALLRVHGINARVLEGGIEGWVEAGGAVTAKPNSGGGV